MPARERWERSWSALGVRPADPSLFDELCARYAEPHRAYHTMRHLDECFSLLDGAQTRPARPGHLEIALWFHDAVYDTRARRAG
jgi:predicted metal-dependent HD superfamily phosphohydrolase